MKKIITLIFVLMANIAIVSCDSEAQENPAAPYHVPEGAEEVIIGYPGLKIDVSFKQINILEQKTQDKNSGKLSSAEWRNDPRKLVIIKQNGQYFWLSNGNVPLNHIQKILQRDDKTSWEYRIFINPDGLGTITLRIDDYKKRSCHMDIESNYNEYKLSYFGRYETYIGTTAHNVYPPPPNPEEWCPTIKNR